MSEVCTEVIAHGCTSDEDVKLWDVWIGEGEFEFEFLKTAFASTPYFVRMTRTGVTIGIMIVVARLPGVYEIVLLAKRHRSSERGVGIHLLNYASVFYKGVQLVHDHSELPGFYANRNFHTICCMPEWCIRIVI